MSAAQPPVIVLRSNDICFLGILRSLGAVQAPVHSVVFDWPGAGPWHSQRSKWFAAHQVIANPFTEPERAAQQFKALGEHLLEKYQRKCLVIPSSDTNLRFLLDHFEMFAPYFSFIGSEHFNLSRKDIHDKARCFEVLASQNVAMPKTVSCETATDIQRCVSAMSYPCIYKPSQKDYGQSFYKKHGGLKAIECANPHDLKVALEKEMNDGFSVVVQEKIIFKTVYDEIPFYLYADKDSNIRMAATAIKEQIQPFPFGTATVLRLSYHQELFDLAQKVAKAIKWRGMLMIEFIKDLKDQTWKVIELNGRPWLFIDFFRRSGFNFVGTLYQDFSDSIHWPSHLVAPPDGPHSHVHVHLSQAYEPTLGSQPTQTEYLNWLEGLEGQVSSTMLDPQDERPGIAELNQIANKLGYAQEDFSKTVRKLVSF